jgi:hypothetical protein
MLKEKDRITNLNNKYSVWHSNDNLIDRALYAWKLGKCFITDFNNMVFDAINAVLQVNTFLLWVVLDVAHYCFEATILMICGFAPFNLMMVFSERCFNSVPSATAPPP